MILIMINLFKLNEWVMTSDFRQLEYTEPQISDSMLRSEVIWETYAGNMLLPSKHG